MTTYSTKKTPAQLLAEDLDRVFLKHAPPDVFDEPDFERWDDGWDGYDGEGL